MKNLYEYIIDEGLKDTVKNIISKFKRTQKEDQSKNAKNMEDARLLYYKMTKNSQFASQSDVVHLVKNVRMKFADSNFIFDGDDMTRGFLQGMYDFGWINMRGQVREDPYGERAGDAAYRYLMDEINDRGVAWTFLGRYDYGWSFAKELDLRISSHWMVDWKSDDPFKAIDVR